MRSARWVSLLLAVIWGWTSLFGAGAVALRPGFALTQAPAVAHGPEQAWSLAVAQDGRGTIWAAWEVGDGQDTEIYAAQWSEQGWSEAAPVARRPGAWDGSPSVAVAADGTPWVAWSSTLRSSPEANRIYVSRWTAGRWSSPEMLPVGAVFGGCASCGWATEPALAASPDGTMWAAWVGSDGQEDNIFAQRWSGGVWSLPRQVSADDGSPSLYDRQPQLAVGSNGRPWIAWTANQADANGVPIPGDDEIYASRWTGAAWTTEEMVSRDDDSLDTAPALAVDGQGRPWMAWQARVTEGTASRLRIVTSSWDAGRQAWAQESIASSPLAAEVDEMRPTLVPDGSGAMQLAWVARARGETALGYARQEGAVWSAPVLVASESRNGVPAGGQARLVTGETGPAIVCLNPLPQGLLPVHHFEVPRGEDDSLATWLGPSQEVADTREVTVDAYPYRFLAFGDSITLGAYPIDNPLQPPFYPYPSILQDTLQTRANPQYNVVNGGLAGERTASGAERAKTLVREYRPHYVLLMEGTNDVTHGIPPAEVYENLKLMVGNVTKNAAVDGVLAMLATLIPRQEGTYLLEQTRLMNELAIIPLANDRRVPLANQWQAFMDYGDWRSLMWDDRHPNQAGLQLISDTFYAGVLYAWPGSVFEERMPPTTWIEPLPAASPCSGVAVSWNGADETSWVVDYDVQVQRNLGTWTDWLLATTERSGLYAGGREGDQLGFRVRGRDLVGNQSDWSDPATTVITDDEPPQAWMIPLPAAQTVPFAVKWQGSDGCGSIAAYHVQYRVGASSTWIDWLPYTPGTSATFAPAAPSFGERAYFRVQARDQAGNWSAWSPEVSTLLARYTVGGQVLNIRHEPVLGATYSTNPVALAIAPQAGGRFLAYVKDGGSYEIAARRDTIFGSLPPMQNVTVDENVTGLIFVLPPKDDGVMNGGFEAGGLDGWTLGGSSLPSLSTEAHTGVGAARLDGTGGSSSLRQVISPAAGGTQAHLSLLARLEQEQPGEASTLQVVLSQEGSSTPPVTHTLSLESETWIHAWYEVGDLQGEPLAVTLLVSGSPAILLDEVSLGTALPGGGWVYLPITLRH
jgi:lysophospholipase L1-like esterase